MSEHINIQTGLVKTTANYQTELSPNESQVRLEQAIRNCNFKIIKKAPNQIVFTTPVTLRSWGYKMTALISKQGRGSFVSITAKYKLPISLDILGAGKKEIEKLQQFL